MGKLAVVSGCIIDVVVDLRVGSPTYGKHHAVKLDVEGWQLYVPDGFAHGFLFLKRELRLQVPEYYAPDYEQSIKWNDAYLQIDWGVESPMVSEKDLKLLALDFKSPFWINSIRFYRFSRGSSATFTPCAILILYSRFNRICIAYCCTRTSCTFYRCSHLFRADVSCWGRGANGGLWGD